MLTLESRRKELMMQIKEAQDLDASNKLMEALQKYMSSLKLLSDQLLLECHLPDFISGERNKQNIELCVWCSGRMKLIYDKMREQKTILEEKKESKPNEDPIQKAIEVNKRILQSHNQFRTKDKYASMNKSLSIQRRLAENIHIAKKHKEMIEKKQREAEMEIMRQAEERFTNRTGDDAHDIMRKQVTFQVIKYENQHYPFKEYHALARNDFLGILLSNELVHQIMNTSDHPLKRYMESEQFRILFLIKNTTDTSNNNSDGTVKSGLKDEVIENYEKMNKSNEIASLLQDVKKSFQNVVDMFFLSYKQLDSVLQVGLQKPYDKQAISNDDSNSIHQCLTLQLESFFYSPVWAALRDLFKKLNFPTLNKIKALMQKFKDTNDLEYFGVKEELKLKEKTAQPQLREKHEDTSTNEQLEIDGLRVKWMNAPKQVPYESTIKTFKNASKLCPVTAKIMEFSNGFKQICSDVEHFYMKLNKPPPELGADELLPVISYALIKSNEETLYLDCCILMEIMDESQSKGEEGYCVTTIITSFEQWSTL